MCCSEIGKDGVITYIFKSHNISMSANETPSEFVHSDFRHIYTSFWPLHLSDVLVTSASLHEDNTCSMIFNSSMNRALLKKKSCMNLALKKKKPYSGWHIIMQ